MCAWNRGCMLDQNSWCVFFVLTKLSQPISLALLYTFLHAQCDGEPQERNRLSSICILVRTTVGHNFVVNARYNQATPAVSMMGIEIRNRKTSWPGQGHLISFLNIKNRGETLLGRRIPVIERSPSLDSEDSYCTWRCAYERKSCAPITYCEVRLGGTTSRN